MIGVEEWSRARSEQARRSSRTASPPARSPTRVWRGERSNGRGGGGFDGYGIRIDPRVREGPPVRAVPRRPSE